MKCNENPQKNHRKCLFPERMDTLKQNASLDQKAQVMKGVKRVQRNTLRRRIMIRISTPGAMKNLQCSLQHMVWYRIVVKMYLPSR